MVIQKYGFLSHPNNLDNLTAKDFRSFLLLKNNKNWDNIHRTVKLNTSDMEKLKSTLKLLLD